MTFVKFSVISVIFGVSGNSGESIWSKFLIVLNIFEHYFLKMFRFFFYRNVVIKKVYRHGHILQYRYHQEGCLRVTFLALTDRIWKKCNLSMIEMKHTSLFFLSMFKPNFMIEFSEAVLRPFAFTSFSSWGHNIKFNFTLVCCFNYEKFLFAHSRCTVETVIVYTIVSYCSIIQRLRYIICNDRSTKVC